MAGVVHTPIGQIQGVVSDASNALNHQSPQVGITLTAKGVIHLKTQRQDGGDVLYGFFLQNTHVDADGDPQTSDGLFVAHGTSATILQSSGGFYTPTIGDEVDVTGMIIEVDGMTQLSQPILETLYRSGVDLGTELPAFDTNPPDDIDDANRYWERREGMRGSAAAGSIALGGRAVSAGTTEAELWVARADSTIGQRANAYERRSFRDAHPLDDAPDTFDNSNGYRIGLGSLGLKSAANDTSVMLAAARGYDSISTAITGAVGQYGDKYLVQLATQLVLSPGVDPALNGTFAAPVRSREFSLATQDLGALFDFRDDPFDACDFEGNPGCALASPQPVLPPFINVPPSDAAYQQRLLEIAGQVINDLQSPDILFLDGVEDQDLCFVDAGSLSCDEFDDADGLPDVAQELVLAIIGLGGPSYATAMDRDGADSSGASGAFIYRTDRVEMPPADAGDPVLGSVPSVIYPNGAPLPFNTDVQNPKSLNAGLPASVVGEIEGDNVFSRAPQTGLFRIWPNTIGDTAFQEIYLVGTHFASGPPSIRIDQRTEQGNFSAAIIDALQNSNPGVFAGVLGQLHAYPRPDDPLPTPNETDQLSGLYNIPMINVWNYLVSTDPVSAFSTVDQGESSTLIQMFIVPALSAEFDRAQYPHVNSDWPDADDSDGARGTSVHDPLVAAFSFGLRQCPGSPDQTDTDGDDIPDFCDVCEGDNSSGDADGDGVCGNIDRCFGDNGSGDDDGDGICGNVDACPTADDSADADNDGVPDGCDVCVGDDSTGDTDNNGRCNDVSLCLGDEGFGDSDNDGFCGNIDRCSGPDDAPFCIGDLLIAQDGQPNGSHILRIDLAGLDLESAAEDPLTAATDRTRVLEGPIGGVGLHSITSLSPGALVTLEQDLDAFPTGQLVRRSADGSPSGVIIDELAHAWFSFASGLFKAPGGNLLVPSEIWSQLGVTPIPGVPADGRDKILEVTQTGELVRYYNGEPAGPAAWLPDGAVIQPGTGDLIAANYNGPLYRFARSGAEGSFLGILQTLPTTIAGLAVHPVDGRLFACEYSGTGHAARIFELAPDGTILRSFDAGPAVNAALEFGSGFGGCAMDERGRFLAVVDYNNDEILIFDTDTLTNDDRRPVIARFAWNNPFKASSFTFSSLTFVLNRIFSGGFETTNNE